jgi:hypothetical protein
MQITTINKFKKYIEQAHNRNLMTNILQVWAIRQQLVVICIK